MFLLFSHVYVRNRQVRRGMIIGSCVIGVSILLLFVMLIVYLCKRPITVAAPYTVKDSPPLYAPDEMCK